MKKYLKKAMNKISVHDMWCAAYYSPLASTIFQILIEYTRTINLPYYTGSIVDFFCEDFCSATEYKINSIEKIYKLKTTKCYHHIQFVLPTPRAVQKKKNALKNDWNL